MSFAHYCEEPSQSFSWLKHLFLTHVQLKCLPPITWSSLSSLGCLWQPPRLTCSSVSICVKKNSCVLGRGGRFFGGSCLACTSSWVWCLPWRRKKRKRNRKMRWERRSRKSYNMELVCTWPSNCSSSVFLHKNSVIQPALNGQQAERCLGSQHKGKLSLAGDESFPKIACFE